MNLDYSYHEITKIIGTQESSDKHPIRSIAFDTRKIIQGENTLFFALNGVFRDGHDFIQSAYDKGVRYFVVSKKGITDLLEGSQEIVVPNTLDAILLLAAYHRKRFPIPLVAITGSNGKTTVKEWLAQILGARYKISRSPKSYNSLLGVALSVLEINHKTEISLIEVGISSKENMDLIRDLLHPSHGIMTSFGSAHRELFKSEKAHLEAKLRLFKDVPTILVPKGINANIGTVIQSNEHTQLLQSLKIKGDFNMNNARLAIAMAIELGLTKREIEPTLHQIQSLALRLESSIGVNNNIILNDTYSLDLDSLRSSLEYQLANSKGKKRIAIIGLKNDSIKEQYRSVLDEFNLDAYYFHGEQLSKYDFENSIILIKGNRELKLEQLAYNFKARNHQTYLEIDLKSIRHNINYTKSLLNPNTKLLCMVKASSYGSDAKTMGNFLEEMGIDYLGVAYVDEGIELRQSGISTPIFVMNAEEHSFTDCVKYSLEPAVFSIRQAELLIKELITLGIMNFPVHLKLETGMNRLGFTTQEIEKLINLLSAQPELKVKSVYSHLAESDNIDSAFTKHQIEQFEIISDQIINNLPYDVDRHILNSEGIQNYTSAQFDMVRLGIGMFGVNGNTNLRSSISWISSISQIKSIEPGDSVGYSRSFIAFEQMKIAIIPVGYADGFKRSLGNGKGGVYINNKYCPTLGNVCMDMIMVNVTKVDTEEGDYVEIIGENQSVLQFADNAQTIPYEIMTSFSQRVHRVYVDQ
ncbi:MAG: alanine racemase [Crocinitomicaceae bacterium]|nr:alanine racemase [Crocinitomicaceae bacterium]